MKYSHRWKEAPQSTFNVIIKNEEGNKAKFFEYEIFKSTDWIENKIEFTVPEDVNIARLFFINLNHHRFCQVSSWMI